MSSNAFLTDQRLQSAPPKLERPASDFPGGPPQTGIGQDQPRATMNGVISATGLLMSMLLVAGFFGWNLVEVQNDTVTSIPSWLMGAVAIGVVLLGVAYFKPHLTKIIGPIYAIVQGLFVGAISRVYDTQYDGIVLQATMITIGVFLAMLFMYRTRIIKVTDRLRRMVVAMTMGLMAVYLFQFVMNIVGVNFTVPFLHDSGPIGIAISLGIVGLAAFNYLLDFDFVDRAVDNGAPKDMEWVAAFGLLVTTVWLYIELLRLLSKLRD